MPVQTSIDVEEIVVRYRQPYVSEALNRKALAGEMGIQHGFRIATDIDEPNSIRLLTDAQLGTSAANLTNQANPEFSVTWIRDADLSLSLPSGTAWYHLFVNHGYELGQDTAPTLTWYSSAEAADSGVVKDGMYFGSAQAVGAGLYTQRVATTYTLSNGTVLKRATSSTSSGSRTRVRGENEEPVFYTDFNSRLMSPVDITQGNKLALSAQIISRDQTSDVDTYLSTDLLVPFAPETNDSALMFWRRFRDQNNRPIGDPQSASYRKTYTLPAYIPLLNSSVPEEAETKKVRLFVRYSALRNDAARAIHDDPNIDGDWTIGLTYLVNKSAQALNLGEGGGSEIIGGVSATTLPAEPFAIQSDKIVLSTTTGYVWKSIELSLPMVDQNGDRVTLGGAAVTLNFPDFHYGEAVSIDRVMVESDVKSAVDPADGYQNLASNALGRYAVISDGISSDTLLKPTKKGLAVVPGVDALPYVLDADRQYYAAELADNTTLIGLPLRDVEVNNRFERADDDFSIASSSNIEEAYSKFENIFKQSSLVINAPGQYDTLPLINALEDASATVPDALRAPQRAGLTVNNGNVVVRKAKGRLRPDFIGLGGSPSHETGLVVARSAVIEEDIRYGTLNDAGSVEQGWSAKCYAQPSVGEIAPIFNAQAVFYYDPNSITGPDSVLGGEHEHSHAIKALPSLKSLLSTAQTVLSETQENFLLPEVNNTDNSHYLTHMNVLAADSGQREWVYVEGDPLIPGGTPAINIFDTPFIGLREEARYIGVGAARIQALTSKQLTYSESAVLPHSAQTLVCAGFDDDALLSGANDLVCTGSATVSGWFGTPKVKVGLSFTNSSVVNDGLLSPAERLTISSQFVDASEHDLQELSPLGILRSSLEAVTPYDSTTRMGCGVEIQTGLVIDPFSSLITSDMQVDGSDSFVQIAVSPYVESATSTMQSTLNSTETTSTNILYYLTPVRADGSSYGSSDSLEPGTMFRYQYLSQNDSYNYHSPVLILRHTILKTDVQRAVLTGELRLDYYRSISILTGIADPNSGDILTSGFANAGALSAFILSSISLSAVRLPFRNFNYFTINDITPKTLSAAVAEIQLGLPSFDPTIASEQYKHLFTIAVGFDASFATSALKLHPMVLSPLLVSSSFTYRRAGI